jgi:hypothetical protein
MEILSEGFYVYLDVRLLTAYVLLLTHSQNIEYLRQFDDENW